MLSGWRGARWTMVTGALAALALVVGCQPEQRPGVVETIGTPQSGSVSASVSGISPSGSVSSAPETTTKPTPSASASLAPEVKPTAGAAKGAATPTQGDGVYTPVSNVDIYQLISHDVAEISTLTNAVNKGKPLPSQEILAIYEQGQHAKIGESSRMLRKFATDPKRAQEFPDAAAFSQSETFLDDPVIAAINGTGAAVDYSPAQRRQAIQKGLLRILRYWSVQELMGAESKLRDGNVDPAKGAPHNVDEAWAIYVGAEQDGTYPYSLAATAQSREGNFEREGAIDKPLREAFARAQQAALHQDLDAFTQAKTDVLSRFNALFYLASARYLNEAVTKAQEGHRDSAAAELVEGLSFYQTIQPTVAKADGEADPVLVAFYQSDPATLTTAERDQALAALNQAAEALLLKPSDRLSPADFN